MSYESGSRPASASWNSDLTRAIELGTPPFERLRIGSVERTTQVGREGAQRWRDAAATNDRRSANLVLAARGLTPPDLERAFSADAFVGHELPQWASELTSFLDALPAAALKEDEYDNGSGLVASISLVPVATSLLNWQVRTEQLAYLDPKLVARLAEQLSLRLVIGCAAVLELEAGFAPVKAWDFGRVAWLDRLCNFPALTYVLGTAVRQWRESTLEIIARLGADLDRLRAERFVPSTARRVVDVQTDLGDRHNDGRSVAVLIFDDGSKVVYKPKSGCSAATFLALSASFLPEQGTNYRILDRGHYHWESYLAQSVTTDAIGANQFFRQFGGLVRLLQLVEGRDFWVDNLRVDASTPYFIDFECILQPRLADAGFAAATPHFDLDYNTFVESVLASAAVSQPILVDGIGKQEFGALSGPGTRALPLGMWSGYGDRQNGNIWVKDGRMYWRPDIAWPLTRGRPAHAKNHLAELEAGYRACQERLEAARDALLSPGAPLAGVDGLTVRVLLRSTWEYLVFIRASMEPSTLLDANAREIVLAHVLGSAPQWGMTGHDKRRAALAWAEVDSIRGLDVPLFLNHPGESGVHTEHGLIADEVFEGTAMQRLTNRIAKLDQFDTDVQVEVMKLAVEMLDSRETETTET